MITPEERREAGPYPDPFLDEVKELKRAASERVSNDFDAFAERLLQVQARLGDRVVDLSGKRSPGKVA